MIMRGGGGRVVGSAVGTAIFAATGLLKILAPADANALLGVGAGARLPFAALEIGIAIALLSPRLSRSGAVAGSLIFLGGAMYAVLGRSVGAPACGCFGSLASIGPGIQVALSGVGLAALAPMAFESRQRTPRAVDPSQGGLG
jgi:hypothetical protein